MLKDHWFKNIAINIVYIWLVVFAFIPICFVIICSFLENSTEDLYQWQVTLANYETIISPLYL